MALGFASLVVLGVFEALVEDQVISAERDVVAIRQVTADNQALAAALASQQPALKTYVAALGTPDRSPRGLSERDDLLNDYLAAAGESSAALERLGTDARRAGVDAAPAQRAAIAWEAWAASRRTAAAQTPPGTTPTDADGEALFAAFTGADRLLAQSLRAQEEAAATHANSLGADHARVFFSGLAVEAIALLLLALALLRQVLRPLALLTDAAAELAGGRTANVPFQDRDDEVGSLARALTLWQRASTEMFRVFQRSPIGIARVTADGRVLEANPSFEQMVGVAPGALDGRDLAALVAPIDRQPMLMQLKSVTDGDHESTVLEARCLRNDATEFWADVTFAAVPVEDGSRYLLAMVEDVDVRKRQELELRHRAAHDPLTGLPNRSLFEDRLAQAVKSARRHRTELAVVLVDLDRFKPVNDELGHHAGDEVLRQVARRLRAALRESDTVARLGGDEFAVILPEQDAEGAQRTVGKLERAMAEPFSAGGQLRQVGMSAGVARFPESGTTPAALLRVADDAMYRAKRRRLGARAGDR